MLYAKAREIFISFFFLNDNSGASHSDASKRKAQALIEVRNTKPEGAKRLRMQARSTKPKGAKLPRMQSRKLEGAKRLRMPAQSTMPEGAKRYCCRARMSAANVVARPNIIS